MELLYETRQDIAAVRGKMYFFMRTPEVRQTPVLEPDKTGMVDGTGVSIYGTVLHDGGIYRMWYQAWPTDWDGGDVSLVGYAESDDGVVWKKPDLGLVDYHGTKNNLCDLGFHSPSVFIDPVAPESHRYRAAGYTRPNRVGSVDVARAGYFTSHSSDGLHWTLDSSEPTWDGADVITTVYHPARKHGIVALKHTPRAGGIPRRSIWQAELENGRWSRSRAALVPDEFDDIRALSEGFATGDYYGMGMMPAGHGLVGFVWQFRHTLPRTRGSEAGVFGATDVSLAYQVEAGDRWLHLFGRKNFLSHADVPWGEGGIYTASCVTPAGDEERLYIVSTRRSHGWYLNSEWQRQPEQMRELIRDGIGRISYATWPTGRLFGFHADPDGALELKLGPYGTDVEVLLNYETETAGRVRGEVADVSGCSLDDAVDLDADGIRTPLRWKDGTRIPTSGKPFTLRLHANKARIYGYEVNEL
jgi:hypothetical protein